MTTDQSTLAALIAFAAYVVSGFSGFGAGLTMVPLMSLFIDLKTVVAVATACAVPCGTGLAIGLWRHADWRTVGRMAAGAAAGVGVGTAVLVFVHGKGLRMAFGLLVALFALRILFERPPEERKPHRADGGLAVAAGFIGGLVFGVYGAGGPAFVVYLAHRFRDKARMRGTLICLFFLVSWVRVASYAAGGLWTADVLQVAAWAVPAACAGCVVGNRLQRNAGSPAFRKVVALILLAAGVLLVVR